MKREPARVQGQPQASRNPVITILGMGSIIGQCPTELAMCFAASDPHVVSHVLITLVFIATA